MKTFKEYMGSQDVRLVTKQAIEFLDQNKEIPQSFIDLISNYKIYSYDIIKHLLQNNQPILNRYTKLLNEIIKGGVNWVNEVANFYIIYSNINSIKDFPYTPQILIDKIKEDDNSMKLFIHRIMNRFEDLHVTQFTGKTRKDLEKELNIFLSKNPEFLEVL
jgi:hypothetical protein